MSNLTERVLSKLDRLDARVAKTKAVLEKAVNDKIDSIKEETAKQISSLEKKIAHHGSPHIIKSYGSVTKENDARVKSELLSFIKSGKGATELKLFESAEQYAFLKKERQLIQEASALTGSGANIGGRTSYDPVTVVLRQLNSLRVLAKEEVADSSVYQFRVLEGNAGAQWGYSPIQNNGAPTTYKTSTWSRTLSDINVQFPIRNAVVSDIGDGLENSITFDLVAEFSQTEAQGMISNDPNGSASLPTGGTAGVYGLNYYAGAAPTFSGGTFTNSAIVGDGNHLLATYDQTTSNAGGKLNLVQYSDLINLVNAIPTQYRYKQLCWFVNPSMMGAIRGLVDKNGTPVFERMDPLIAQGTYGGVEKAIGQMLGFPVVISQYLDNPTSANGVGTKSLYPIYFGAFDGLTVVDRLDLVVRRYSETLPGSTTFFAEKRMTSAIRDPLGLVRYRSTATSN